MRFLSSLAAVATLVSSSTAHYCFNRLIVGDEYTGLYEYVRKNNNSNSPVTDITSTDLRCNAGGLDTGNVTSTYKVAAGDEIGFALDTGIGHPGPLLVYMSEVPSTETAATYDGSGSWFKVYELGVHNITSAGLQWATNELTNFTFQLPEKVPAGQYLLRVESIALHGAETFEGAQYYISCAQIEVTSSSEATPSPDVSIPGVYTGYEPGILIDIYWPIPTNYTMPGPALWPAGIAANNATTATTVTSAYTVSGSATSAAATDITGAATAAASSSASATPTSSSVAAATSTTAAAVASSSSSSAVSSAVTTSAKTLVAVSSGAPSSVLGSISSAASNNTSIASGFLTFARSSVTVASYYSAQPSASGSISTGSSGNSTSTGSGTVKQYYQCGGAEWTGATECESPYSCVVQNDFYSQCV